MPDLVLKHGWLFVWFILVATVYLVRDIFPVDETRYLSVAWEMWLRGDFLLPYLNGHLYTDKPPMLFWLFHLGWSVLGVNEWWPRLVAPLFALSGLFLVRSLARQIWPLHSNVAMLAPWVLGSGVYWAFYMTTVMFDVLLMTFVLLALTGVWRAAVGKEIGGWLLVGIAGGLGMLIKGPVMMLYIFFPVILAPWWSSEVKNNKFRWFAGMLLAVLLATIIAFCWLLPAVNAGGAEYERNILWHQSVDRAFSSFSHNRPFWWYVPMVLLVLFPWSVWPPLWRALTALKGAHDNGIRFLLCWIFPTFILLSIFSGKQAHYLIPLFPAVALLISRAIENWQQVLKRTDQILPASLVTFVGLTLLVIPKLNFDWIPKISDSVSPGWGIAILAIAAFLIWRKYENLWSAAIPFSLLSGSMAVFLMAGILPVAAKVQDVTPTALYLSVLQNNEKPIAHLGKYHGQFQFKGRLEKPLTVLAKDAVNAWCKAHPNGYLITYEKSQPDPNVAHTEFVQQYRNQWIVVWSAASIKKQFGLSN